MTQDLMLMKQIIFLDTVIKSIGYVYYIKEKFSDKFPPKIINLENKKRKLPYWIYYKPFNQINEDKLILLNYSKSSKFNFEKYVVLDNHQNKCFYLRKK